jgi:hypothetical protein
VNVFGDLHARLIWCIARREDSMQFRHRQRLLSVVCVSRARPAACLTSLSWPIRVDKCREKRWTRMMISRDRVDRFGLSARDAFADA